MAPVMLTIGAEDRGWVMGFDIQVDLDTTTRMDELFRLISKIKRIPKSRFVLKVPPFLKAPSKAEPDPSVSFTEFRWDKGDVGGKADWAVRRCGIYDGAKVTVEPTFPAAWSWEPLQFHEDSYMDAIALAISAHPERRMTLQELAMATIKPPPVFATLRTFLRMYPEVKKRRTRPWGRVHDTSRRPSQRLGSDPSCEIQGIMTNLILNCAPRLHFCLPTAQVFQMEVNRNNSSGAGLVYVRLNTPGRPLRRDGALAPLGAPISRTNCTGKTHAIGTIGPTVV